MVFETDTLKLTAISFLKIQQNFDIPFDYVVCAEHVTPPEGYEIAKVDVVVRLRPISTAAPQSRLNFRWNNSLVSAWRPRRVSQELGLRKHREEHIVYIGAAVLDEKPGTFPTKGAMGAM